MKIQHISLSHHAYCLIGNESTAISLLAELEKHHKIVMKGNPDLFVRKYDTLTIDEAREIKSLHETMPVVHDGKKIFILTMNGITVEAQNALLKLLEEPSPYAHFFLIIPSAHLLLPTVKSRMEIVGDMNTGDQIKSDGTDSKDGANTDEAKKFLKLTPAKRIESLKSLLEDVTKEKKSKQEVIEFLNALQKVVYDEKGTKDGRTMLEALEFARKYANDRAPSLKMLLEYVALNMG